MGDPWTEQELSFLRRRWPDMSDTEIAEKLGRTPWAVQTKRYQLGIAIDPADWSSEDDAYIQEHWKEQTNEELAEALGRKPHAVYQRGLSLGLLRRRSAPLGSRTWTADELLPT